MRAKFKVISIQSGWQEPERSIRMIAVYDKTTPEAQKVDTQTPAGKIDITVTTREAIEAMTLGRTFYVDFMPVEPVRS